MNRNFLVLSMMLALASPAWALNDDDMLSLVAMPLAVAAVADLIEVPPTDLMTLVSALNDALVPPAQFVEVVRWTPVVLVDPTASPRLIELVRTEVAEGVRGNALALVVADHLRASGAEIDVTAPRLVRVVDRDIIPTVVSRRVAEVRGHPHGGPPGQIKKEIGVQTGAEVVHGEHPGTGAGMLSRTGVADDRGRAADRPSNEAARPARGGPQQPPGLQKKQGAGSPGIKTSSGEAKGKGSQGKGRGNR